MKNLAKRAKKGFLKVKNIKDNGGKVAGVFCTFTPLEILDAAGFTPVSLCGMSGETIPAAEAHLPKNLCPLIKSSYGFAVSDKCPYTYFSDIIVGETTCDGKKKMYELLNEIRPTYILHLPQGERENALDEWTAELRRFKIFLKLSSARHNGRCAPQGRHSAQRRAPRPHTADGNAKECSAHGKGA